MLSDVAATVLHIISWPASTVMLPPPSSRGLFTLRVTRVLATAMPGAPARLELNGEAGKPGGVVALSAVVTDEHGNPVPKASLTLSASSGKVANAKHVTDRAGRASTRWTPAPGNKPATVTAKVAGTKLSDRKSVV